MTEVMSLCDVIVLAFQCLFVLYVYFNSLFVYSYKGLFKIGYYFRMFLKTFLLVMSSNKPLNILIRLRNVALF